MSELSTPLSEAKWKEVRYLKIHADGPAETHPYEYRLQLPEPLASWDTFDYWEKERTHSMRNNLKRGDVLFDIGAEYGWQSAIYAQFVGGQNMVLFEPSPEYWPNIKAIWQHNNLPDPKGCYAGFASNKTSEGKRTHKGWPKESRAQELRNGLTYRYIHEARSDTPEIMIDEYVKRTGVIPNALTMDTEGAELLILYGAEVTLRNIRPIVWVSVHSDLMLKNYGQPEGLLFSFMQRLGYSHKLLAVDHEAHYVFWPSESSIND